MIPNDFIQTLLARVDIIDVIDRLVPLKKAGANYQACCPFHSEKTPSFTVSPTKQFFHCFGCGAHGTAIGFLMDYAGKSFPEAVETLARDAGLEVPRTQRSGERDAREATDDLCEILLAAARFYRAQLKASPAAIDYLKRRGLTGVIAGHFGIGYAPSGWQNLAAVFPDYANTALEAAGLVIAAEHGKRYDRFRDRIMFPIHDTRGRVTGFGGRVLGDGEPKYLNSPETSVFTKGKELYGLYLARNAMRQAGRVVVVEGYMDVVALAQHGVEYVVATLGTSTTETHAQKLFRLTDTVVFCFDGDAAGRKAAWRALENTLPVLTDGKEARFLFLPEGEDPDDFVRKRGKASFEDALDAAVPLSEYLLRALATQHSPTTAEGRAALVAAARPYVAQIAAPILGALVRRQLAELAGLPEAELRLPAPPPAASGRSDASGSRHTASRHTRRPPSLLRALLQGLLLEPSLARRHVLPGVDRPGPDAEAWNALLEHCRSAPGEPSTASVVQHFAGTEYAALLADVLASAADHALSTEQVEVHVLAAAERLRRAQDEQSLHAMLAQPFDALTSEERETLARRLREAASARAAR